MPRFAANLSMLYNELPFLDRFEAAAADGFQAVEYLFPYAFPADELAARLKDIDVRFAYDDFGAGQARLNELWEVPAHFVKFDMGLIRGIHEAGEAKRRGLAVMVDHLTPPLVATPLSRCPGLHLLVTSRRVLGLDGEHLHQLARRR